MTMDDALLDVVYQRMRGTGPEYQGWLSNHGPMAADALIRMGRADVVDRWVDGYLGQLEDAPRPRWQLEESDWRDLLGDPPVSETGARSSASRSEENPGPSSSLAGGHGCCPGRSRRQRTA